ncbi:EAL domain-containing protein [Metabacillus litoralis]|uniref:EAL domain-containing protein n=1 Tax=Metabacillus litoralis TaxID=152268 RepID=UPI000EF60301|nr:EAL domain-containing protein [Metabacillus litoralis]
MLKIGRLPTTTLFVSAFIYFTWKIFIHDPLLESLGLTFVQIIVGILSLIWLIKAYKSMSKKSKYFWLLLGIGVILTILSNTLWFKHQLFESTTLFPDNSYFIWLLAYMFYLSALIYKVREFSLIASTSSYIFNIVVFMISATAVSAHYLIRPNILKSESFIMIITNIAYPIISLSILFVITILYYLIQQVKQEENMFLYLIIGFFLQVIADSYYAYQATMETYQPGGLSDFLWMVSILLIGIGGYYAKNNRAETRLHIMNPFDTRERIFPYFSVIVLIVLVTHSYEWKLNLLSLGLVIVMNLIIARQLRVLTKNKKLVEEYKFLAYHDPLTGLNNRASFQEDLSERLNHATNKSMAVLLLDLDRFKVINDTLGHYRGDHVLIKTAERLSDALDDSAQIYRLGGDEFVIIVSEGLEEQCSMIAHRILNEFTQPFRIDEHEIIVTPSIGISRYPDHGDNGEDLLKNADAAMYLAKENGKNNFKFYNTELEKINTRKMKIENELRCAIEKNHFSLSYQPKVDLETNKINGMEALLRWNHPELGIISPVEFIPIAEETGQIISIGEWVLKTACKQSKAWQEKGYPSLCVSINVSVRQLKNKDFVEIVSQALQESRLEPQFLELEITESIMQEINVSIHILNRLRKLGIKISIDDFGTGYSSLHVLQQLPIDTIKIDKSFIKNPDDHNQQMMIKTIIDLGNNMNLNVVAEGIEKENQVRILLENGCKIGQGYLFSQAVNSIEFEKKFLEKIS